ncbi:Uncharacterized protein M6B38_240270 [Iris pallida]|uniref:Uncharacterized protein n=1 Tax=Iris pallida TaxID=29817 RepID=A0AAX6DKG6_IRIPA|nr:Uncharacterized protein M6B38_240270 [Iris pallida]
MSQPSRARVTLSLLPLSSSPCSHPHSGLCCHHPHRCHYHGRSLLPDLER